MGDGVGCICHSKFQCSAEPGLDQGMFANESIPLRIPSPV